MKQSVSGTADVFAATLPAVTAPADRATPIVEHLPSVATELTPTFDVLDRLSPDLRALMLRPGPVITAPNARDRSTGARSVSVAFRPQGLAHQPRPLGQNRRNAYRAPGGGASPVSGLRTLTGTGCGAGDPTQPAGLAAEVAELLLSNVFRTPGRDVARPGCTPQGAYPGSGTLVPQLAADAPAATAPKGPR